MALKERGGNDEGFVVERRPPDEYGMSHPVETPELLEAAFQAFEEQLPKLPSSLLKGVKQAHSKCPDLCTKKFKMAFLRCEVFNPALAAKRYAKYWNKRIEIFKEKAFQPITLDGALKDDVETLKKGFVHCLPRGCRDARGRSIFFLDCVALSQPGIDQDSLLRCSLYVLHCALEDEDTQRYGAVALIRPNKHTNLALATTRTRLFLNSTKGIVPLRQAGFHVMRPPSYLRPIISVVLLLLTDQLRKRARVHYGTEEDGLKELAAFGISSSAAPTMIGGTYPFDMDDWIQNREKIEAEGPRI